MSGGRVRALLLAVGAAVSFGGCELKDDGDNLVNGKEQFVAKCASCHTLARAGATGVTGPNLDEAWQQASRDGFGRSTYKGMVHRQILQPARTPQTDPFTGKPGASMPAELVTGEDAQDVAAYVAHAAARRGEDAGRLGQAGVKRSDAVAKAKGGVLEIPADPSGGLSYKFGSAEADAGPLTINSPNESSVDHNIALEGDGVGERGAVVKNGGVSTVKAELASGDYVFFCSVPGHREGGMEGKLTVK